MKQGYPAFILNMNDGSEHPFLVCVPDMEIFTEGDSFADAIEMECSSAWYLKQATKENECSLSVAFFHPSVL